MKHLKKNKFCLLLSLSLFLTSFAFSHSSSRYFPFIERPEEFLFSKKINFTPSVFLTTASTAFRRSGGNGGIPELWGDYDLKDIIFALKQVNGPGYTDPTTSIKSSPDWEGKSIGFKVDGKINSRGVNLGYRQDLGFAGLWFGANIPFMYVSSSNRFTFRDDASNVDISNLGPGEKYLVERIRSKVHKDLGIKGVDWSKTGFGDLDLHIGWKNRWDHELLMRSIDLSVKFGLLFPTGEKSQVDYPMSVSFMDGGHWGLNLNVLTQFELKQDLKVGFILGISYLFKNTRELRIPVYMEPAIFSPLKDDVTINPGNTYKFSPYIVFENLSDGLHVQGRYTYLRHSFDCWTVFGKNDPNETYLTQTHRDVVGYDDYLTEENIKENIRYKKDLTLRRAHYVSLEVTYDSKEAFNNWMFDPIFYFVYDSPVGGNGFCKTHQISAGMELHF